MPFIAATQHLHLLGDDFSGETLLTVLACPFTGAQTTFYVDGTAFTQVLTCNFSQTVVEHHTMPFGFFARFASLPILPSGRSGNRDIAHRGATDLVSDFGISPKIADENYFVD